MRRAKLTQPRGRRATPFGAYPGGSPGSLTGMYAAETFTRPVLSGAASAFSLQAQQMLQGGYNPMGQAQAFGSVIGGLAGRITGIAGLDSLGSAALGWFAAPEQARSNAYVAMSPFLNAFGGVGGGGWQNHYLGQGSTTFGVFPGSPAAVQSSRMGMLTEQLNGNIANQLGMRGLPPELRLSLGDVGATFGAVASGLFAGGVNPMQMGGTNAFSGGSQADYARYRGNAASFDKFINYFDSQARQGGRFGPGGFDYGRAESGFLREQSYWMDKANASRPWATGAVQESLAETYTRRLGQLFGKTAPDVAKQLAPLLGSLPETGNNIADILTRFGPELTTTYGRIQNDSLTSSVDPMTLSRTSARTRGAERRAAIGSLSARGSGALMESAYGDEMDAIGGLPGGRDSLSYATARARRRGAMMTRYGQEDITNFGIPMSNLETDMAIGQVLPFSPGRSMGMGLEHIRMSKNQIGVLDRRMSDLRSRGELTEADEYAMTQQRNALRIGVAQDVANLAMPMMNQMLSMNAGRPGNWRGDAASLAAMRLRGTPIRLFGASDGGQAREQDDFVNQAGAGVANAPYSRTQNLNNNNMSETNGLLRDIRDALRMRSGGPEMRGATPISRPNDMNQRALYDGAN